jgi:hypothetical protein
VAFKRELQGGGEGGGISKIVIGKKEKTYLSTMLMTKLLGPKPQAALLQWAIPIWVLAMTKIVWGY